MVHSYIILNNLNINLVDLVYMAHSKHISYAQIISNRLKEYRLEKSMTCEEMAYSLDVSEYIYDRFENDEKWNPTIDYIQELEAQLNIKLMNIV